MTLLRCVTLSVLAAAAGAARLDVSDYTFESYVADFSKTYTAAEYARHAVRPRSRGGC